MKYLIVVAVSAASLSAFAQNRARIDEEPWGALADGRAIARYTITNSSGAKATFMPLGAAILSVEAPDRDGTLADVVLGYDSAADYNTSNFAQFGLTIGRYANRIASTKIALDGQTFELQRAARHATASRRRPSCTAGRTALATGCGRRRESVPPMAKACASRS